MWAVWNLYTFILQFNDWYIMKILIPTTLEQRYITIHINSWDQMLKVVPYKKEKNSQIKIFFIYDRLYKILK